MKISDLPQVADSKPNDKHLLISESEFNTKFQNLGAGTGGTIQKTIFFTQLSAVANKGNYSAQSAASSGTVNFGTPFCVPDDFVSLVGLYAIFIPSFTGNVNFIRVLLSYGQNGQPFNQFSTSPFLGFTIPLVADQVYFYDCSSAFSPALPSVTGNAIFQVDFAPPQAGSSVFLGWILVYE